MLFTVILRISTLTNTGTTGDKMVSDYFDYDSFYNWARATPNVFISEKTMPDDFVIVASTEKTELMKDIYHDKDQHKKIRTENLYVYQKSE